MHITKKQSRPGVLSSGPVNLLSVSDIVREASLPEGCDPLAVGAFCPGRGAI